MAASFFSGIQLKTKIVLLWKYACLNDVMLPNAGLFLIPTKEIVVILKDYCEQSLKVNRGSSALQQELTA